MKKIASNLKLDGNNVISYTTHVATIEGDKLIVLGYWSQTTTKHINKIAKLFCLNVVK
jgi:hypothetical protein